MSDVVIRAEGLGKKYLIGHETHQSHSNVIPRLRDVSERGLQKALRVRRWISFAAAQLVAGDEIEEFWALKDVSFEIKRGEVVGIIGRNGAGKSTLLKILSRITEPSAGRVEIKGRVASLLEVGTGFHPELTGRENIYLNGAILGMTRAEIKRKFDEIVAFAEVEKFLDTPVKHYSSGMYVRLAFAVAAHLEPEILVVDEVLAVGDAEFQKKCLGKMRDVAGGGRTVLFVSHNLAAVGSLCQSAIVINDGRVTFGGEVYLAISHFLEGIKRERSFNLNDLVSRRGRGRLRFSRVDLLDDHNQFTTFLTTGYDCSIRLLIVGDEAAPAKIARVGITVWNRYGELCFNCASDAAHKGVLRLREGMTITCRIPKLPLSAGEYWLSFFIERDGVIEDWIDRATMFTVADASFFGTARNCPPGWEGRSVLVPHSWSCHELAEAVKAI